MSLESNSSQYVDFDSPNVMPPEAFEIDQEQQYRAATYSLIAALLRESPDKTILQHLAELPEQNAIEGDELMLGMSMLGLSARVHTVESIEDEFHQLFIGLGRGELVPYASWYLTGFLMEQPLSELRDDLKKLGFERTGDTSEPEDHAAAMCEVISMMISDGLDFEVQKQFFQRHLSTWLDQFFNDLSKAESAVFYKALGRFGEAFIAFEKQYFSMQA